MEGIVYVCVGLEGKVVGFAVKLGLPPLSNASSLIENLYLIPTATDLSSMFNAVFYKGSPILEGVEDICVFNLDKDACTHLEKLVFKFEARNFEAALIPLISIKGEELDSE